MSEIPLYNLKGREADLNLSVRHVPGFIMDNTCHLVAYDSFIKRQLPESLNELQGPM